MISAHSQRRGAHLHTRDRVIFFDSPSSPPSYVNAQPVCRPDASPRLGARFNRLPRSSSSQRSWQKRGKRFVLVSSPVVVVAAVRTTKGRASETLKHAERSDAAMKRGEHASETLGRSSRTRAPGHASVERDARVSFIRVWQRISKKDNPGGAMLRGLTTTD